MLKECEKPLKRAWDLVGPADARLRWDRAEAEKAITADLDRIRSAGGYNNAVMDELQELLRHCMYRAPVTSWKSVNTMYKSMLVLLRHKNLIKSFIADWDAVVALVSEARPLYKKLSGSDPFQDVFENDNGESEEEANG